MNFSDALNKIKSGVAMCRMGWNGKNQWVLMQTPDEHSKMTQPYLYMVVMLEEGRRILVPWLASQSDLLADDWVEVVFGTAAAGTL